MNTKYLHLLPGQRGRRPQAGMTLVEVVVSFGIGALAVAGIVSGYLFSTACTKQWALSLAANAKAMERIEEIRSAQWSILPPVDQLVVTNFPDQIVALDRSESGEVTVYATNITEISQISTDPPLRRIRVDCIWSFKGTLVLTNTIETCRAADQ